jgi:hypothetical protein
MADPPTPLVPTRVGAARLEAARAAAEMDARPPMLDGEAEALTRKAIELAKAGDLVVLRLCLERICPPRKDRPVTFTLPSLESGSDAKNAVAALVKAVAHGDLTPGEASELARLLDSFTRILEVTEFEERLQRLEAKTNQ